MFAIIATGGKQYRVQQGDTILVEKLAVAADDKVANIEFGEVLLVADGDKVTLGTPLVSGAKVTAKVLDPLVKGDKIIAFKYTHKTRYKRKVGHRQQHTKVQIEKIVV